MYLYARASDTRDFDLMRTLFCADARAVVRDTVSGREETLTGLDEITEFVDKRHAVEFARGDRRRHLTSNFVLETYDGTHAVAQACVCVVQSIVGQPMQLASMGHYEDHLRKENGRWRILQRVLTIEGKGRIPGP